jgi:recombination protein RecA
LAKTLKKTKTAPSNRTINRMKTVTTTAGDRENRLAQLMTPLRSNNEVVDVQYLVEEINKEFGEGTLIWASDPRLKRSLPNISTGSLAVDYLTLGFSKGKINTVSGDTGVGKSHLVYKAIAWYLKMFPTEIVVLIDAENSYEEHFALMAGIDVNSPRFLVYKPESLEEALKLSRRLQQKGVGLIVIDSIESLATDKDFEKEEGESKQLGEKQKMVSNWLKVVINRNNKAWREGRDGTTFIIVQQLREKVGVVFGDPLFETGGRGLQYYPHNKIRLTESDRVRDPKTKKLLRSTITATTTKSRQVGKGLSTSYIFQYRTDDGTPTGIDHYQEIIDIAKAEGLIEEISQQKSLILGRVEVKTKEIRATLVNDLNLLQELYVEVMSILSELMGHGEFKETVGESAQDKLPDETEDVPKKSKRGRPRKK